MYFKMLIFTFHLYPSMTPLGSLGSSQVTTTELFVMEWVDTFSGALENICVTS